MKAIARNVGKGSLFQEGSEVTVKEVDKDGQGFLAWSPYGTWYMYCRCDRCSHLMGGHWDIEEEEVA